MSHTLFQLAQITPVNTRIPNKNLQPGPLLPVGDKVRRVVVKHSADKLRRGVVVIKASASSASVDAGDSVAVLERCFAASPASTSSATNHMDSGVLMKGQYGAFGAVTLEKSKLDTTKAIQIYS
ncbi:unnamed protein product [Rhodiola kirilowii]